MTEKKEFGILKAYAVPHPPIILPEIGRGEEAEIESTTLPTSLETSERFLTPLSRHHRTHRSIAMRFFYLLRRSIREICRFGFPLLRKLDYDLDLGKLIYESRSKKIPMFADTRANKLDHGSLYVTLYSQRISDFKFLRFGLSGFRRNPLSAGADNRRSG